MRKLKLFLVSFLLLFVFVFAGCQDQTDTDSGKEETETAAEELTEEDEELIPVEGEELEMLENGTEELGDEEMTQLDEDELLEFGYADDDGGSAGVQVEEDGSYTSKEEVAAYLHQYGHLPSNFITKSEAQELGWNNKEGNLDEVAPGKSIGGDKYGNYEGMLPVEEGRTYQECDIDFDGGFRNEKRIIYSNDGLIFYTGDHYQTFEQLY